MSLGLINDIKGIQNTFQSLLLVSIVLRDSETAPTTLLLSTHNLKASEAGAQPTGITGFPYNDRDFEPRILNKEIAATQALSDQGIAVTPTVSIELADADKGVWATEKAIGFKGAKLSMYYVFWDAGTGNFSSNYYTIFVGTCGPGKVRGKTLTIQAISKMNANQSYLPVVRIQKRCPWVFPDTRGMTLLDATALQQSAADDPSKDAWHCGYSYLASGANARGNHGPGGGSDYFQFCNNIVDDCLDRLGNRSLVYSSGGFAPIEKDSSGRVTARFGGVRWDQPSQFQSRGFGQPSSVQGFNALNEGKYNEYVPMGWGTYWMDPVVLNIVGDNNFTRMEVLVGMGQTSVRKVIVNDIDVDKLASDVSTQKAQIAIQLWWNDLTTGDRSGKVNGTGIYDGHGDPYGNLKVIVINVPRTLTPSSSIPRIRCLVDGGQVRVYSDTVTYTNQFSSNPAWILMDASIRIGWTYSELDIQTFIDASSFYDEAIPYDNISGHVDVASDGVTVTFKDGIDFGSIIPGSTIFINGISKIVNTVDSYTQLTITVTIGGALANVTYLANGPNTHERFKLGLGITQRITGAELLRGIQVACRSTLIPASTSGLLQLFPEKSLADQQPESGGAIAGSNFNTKIASKHANGSAGNGFVAWKFDYSSIFPDGNDDSSLSLDQLDIRDCPNRISAQFYDEDNGWQQDSLSVGDSEDTVRVGQQVDGSIPVIGLTNFDQTKRVFAVWLAKNMRGNTRGDTGGTYTLTFNTSFKCIHLRMGHIVLMDYPQLAIDAGLTDNLSNPLDGFLARVTAIKPTSNFETVQITIQYHNDDWYVDSYEQNGFQKFTPQFRNALTRPSFPWSPWETQPTTGDVLYSAENWQLGILQDYDTSADLRPLARVTVIGKLPINDFATGGITPPVIGRQGTTAPAGGTVQANRRYYAQVCAKDSSGKITPGSDPTAPCVIDVPAGANTATLTVPVTKWPSQAANYELFVGVNRNKMVSQKNGAVTPPNTPTSINITSFKESTWGIPDVEFNSIVARAKLGVHTGVAGAEIVLVTSTTIKLSVSGMTVNQFAGRKVGLLGLRDNSFNLPVANWTVVSNTTDTLTVSGPNPTTVDRGDGSFGLAAGDVISISILPTVGSDGGGNYIQDTALANVFNGNTGLTVDAEKGRELFLAFGTGEGTYYKIKSNTSNKIYIEGDWLVTPDATTIPFILESNWKYEANYSSSANSKNDIAVEISLDVPNFNRATIFVQAFTVDGGGNESFRPLSPWRLIYVFGVPQTIPDVLPDGYFDLAIIGGNVQIDLANGKNQRLVLTGAAANFLAPVITGRAVEAGDWVALYLDQDATGGRGAPTFNPAFATDIATQQLDGTPSTRSTYMLTFHGTVWALDYFRTGGALA